MPTPAPTAGQGRTADQTRAERAYAEGKKTLVVTLPIEVGKPVDWWATSELDTVTAAGWHLVSATMAGEHFMVAVFVRAAQTASPAATT